jgi:hypothetical protein
MDHIPEIITAVSIATLLIWLAVTRGRTILKDWADKNGYQILHKEFRVFRVGPFWGQSGQAVVYYVTVRDEQGQQWSGWVRCGGRFLGLLSDKADVIWKD